MTPLEQCVPEEKPTKEGWKIADYTPLGGSKIEYDPNYPCIFCKEPVNFASMGGTVICGACDCGISKKTGKRWTPEEYAILSRNAREWYEEKDSEMIRRIAALKE